MDFVYERVGDDVTVAVAWICTYRCRYCTFSFDIRTIGLSGYHLDELGWGFMSETRTVYHSEHYRSLNNHFQSSIIDITE